MREAVLAWRHRCRLRHSRAREIYKDACGYFSPYSTRQTADAMLKIIDDKNAENRARLVATGAKVDQDYKRSRIGPMWEPFFAESTSVPLPRERFWDIRVAKIDSPTRQPMCPGRPAVAAALHSAEHHCTHNDWTACRMRLHMACTGCGTCGPFATSGHTPAPYACRGLSASGFALPWRTARSWARRLHEAGSRNK
jgi:hypothetical protein